MNKGLKLGEEFCFIARNPHKRNTDLMNKGLKLTEQDIIFLSADITKETLT